MKLPGRALLHAPMHPFGGHVRRLVVEPDAPPFVVDLAQQDSIAVALPADDQLGILHPAVARADGGPGDVAHDQEFLAELARINFDQLSPDHNELARQIAGQESALDELQTALGKFQTELDSMDGTR